MKIHLPLVLLICFILYPFDHLHAQQLSSDDLFANAREAAFNDKNYPKAIALTKKALAKSPDYADVRIFLGRLYTWTDKVDSARVEFKRVLESDIKNEDAYLAYGNLEYWNDHSENARRIVEKGLTYHPVSQSLLFLQAKILSDLREYPEANASLDLLLKTYPNFSDARAYKEKIKNASSKNVLGLTYDYVYFDKRFDDPWHLASVDYGRLTKIGIVTGRLNYANRFNSNGAQFELEAYPRISDVFYTYVSAGISGKDAIFPRYRVGFSLYANLPWALEAEAGFRMLSFTDETWIYTASIGKYYSNYWFNFRTFLTPSNNSVSRSFALNVRYYLGGADDFLSFGIGTGISPDDPANSVFFNNGDVYRLKTNFVSLGYRKTFNSTNIGFISISLDDQEYLPETRGNQIMAGLGYIKRF